MKMIQKSQHCKFCSQLLAKSFILSTIDGPFFKKIVIPVTLIPNKIWYFKNASRPPKIRTLTMLQKLWNKCKKCGCDKAEDSEKLCESCKEKRREFWSDIKKIVGVGGAAFLVLIAGGKLTKKS